MLLNEPKPQTYRFLACVAALIGLCLLAVMSAATYFGAPRWAVMAQEIRDASLRQEATSLAPVTWTEWSSSDGSAHGVRSTRQPNTTREEWLQEHRADIKPFLDAFPSEDE